MISEMLSQVLALMALAKPSENPLIRTCRLLWSTAVAQISPPLTAVWAVVDIE